MSNVELKGSQLPVVEAELPKDQLQKRLATLIMAGGQGKRLRPITCFIPKPLIPYKGKSLIDYTLDNSMSFSQSVLVSTTTRVSKSIARHLAQVDVRVVCLQEPELLKTGGAIKYHRDFISLLGIDNLMILMSDHIRKGNLYRAAHYHEDTENDLTLLVSEPSTHHNQVITRDGEVVDYLQPGSTTSGYHSFTGECIFKWPALASWLENKSEDKFDISWGIISPMIRSRKFKIGIYDIGEWEDFGTWSRFLSRQKRNKY